MLRLATSFRDFCFSDLLEVYSDSNWEKAADWPDLPPMFALEMAERDFREYLEDVFFRTPGAVLALWEEKGKCVSALRLEPYKDGLLLEGLETSPVERKKGYATMMINAVQQKLAAQGPVKLYSHVHKKNIASLHTHKKCGFSMVCDHAVYINGNVDYRCCTVMYQA